MGWHLVTPLEVDSSRAPCAVRSLDPHRAEHPAAGVGDAVVGKPFAMQVDAQACAGQRYGSAMLP
jgi:hypothetical protein